MTKKDAIREARNLIAGGASYEEAIATMEKKIANTEFSKDDVLAWVYSQSPLELRSKSRLLNLVLGICLAYNGIIKGYYGIFQEGNISVGLLSGVVPLILAYFIFKHYRMTYPLSAFLAVQALARNGTQENIPGGVDGIIFYSTLATCGIVTLLGFFLYAKLFPKMTWTSQPKI